MLKKVANYVSAHEGPLLGAAAGVALAGLLGYVMLSGSFGLDFIDEMAWGKNVYDNNQAFNSVSYRVGEVDQSDNRIHDNEDDNEGLNEAPDDALAAGDDAPDSGSASLAGNTVQTDNSTRVGSNTAVVDDPTGGSGAVRGGQGDGEGAGGSGGTGEGDGNSGGDPSGPGEGDGSGGGDDDPSGPGPGSDDPSGPSDPDEPSGPGGPGEEDAPPLTDDQKEQLSAREDYVDENGNTLVSLKATVPANWTFARGDSYRPDGVTVTATFRRPDGSLVDVVVPYGGNDGYTAYLSKTWGSGTHEATFVYKDKSTHALYEVMSKRYDVAYGTWNNGWYAAQFPGNYLGSKDLNEVAERIQRNAVPESLVGGYFTDLTDAFRFMITILGRQDVYDRFQGSQNNDYQRVKFLEPCNTSLGTDLSKMAVGFATTSQGNAADPLIYLPSEEGSMPAAAKVALIVEDVPAGFHVQRVAGTYENSFQGDQVLVGYDGTEAEIEVPLGVTRVALTQPNKKVKRLVLSESVLGVDFDSLTRNFPNLEHIQVGDNNNQAFSSYNGVLYSSDGRRVLYVPPHHKAMGAGFDAWSPYAETVDKGAFADCEIDRVTIPAQIVELKAHSFEGSAIDTLEFASETPVAGMAKSGFKGDFYVPDTPYDTACKQWTAALGGQSDMRVGVLGDEGAAPGAGAGVVPGTYTYDAAREVVVLAAEPTVLAGVPSSAPKAYLAPDGITAIGAGAFAATTGMSEVVVPESVRELRANSLVGLGDGVRMTLSGADVVEIDAAAFGGADGSGSGTSVPDMTVLVPGELYGRYLDSWGSVLGDDVARKLLKPADETYLYINNAKYLPLDEANTKLRLLKVFDEGQTFFEPDLRTVEIADAAFSGCASLEIVHIPACVASVGDRVFEGCTNLESVVASGTLPALPDAGPAQLLQPGGGVSYDYEPDTGAVYRTDKDGMLTLVNVPTDTVSITVRANTAHLGDAAFAGCTHFNPNDESVVLVTPETLRSVGAHCFEDGAGLGAADFSACTALTSIGEFAFADNAGLEAVWLPDTATTVGEGAFSDCPDLMYVTAEGPSELAPRTFANCTSLQWIKAPNVSVIGDECFYGCEQLVTLEDRLDVDKITWIGDRAFAYCVSLAQSESTTTLDMKSLTHIGDQAFRSCHTLRTVNLPETLTEMGEEAFRDCTALFTLNAGSSLSTIGRYSFYGCVSLSNVNLSDRQKQALAVVGACAFASCNVIERLDLSGCTNLAYLGDRAFEGCERLLRVTLPASLTKVSDRCFEDCPYFSILELTAAKPTELGSTVFGETPPEYVRIWVPDEQACATYLDAYEKKLDPEYGDGYALSVLEVHSDTSETLRGITYTATGDGHWVVTDALEKLSGDVLLTSDVVAIAPGAFEGCDKLESVQYELGASISLGDRAFAGCKGLKSIALYGGIPEWGESVFEGCPNLESIYLGHSATKLTISRIGPRAFANCPSLANMTVTLPTEEIGDEAFLNCTSLSAIASNSTVRTAFKRYGDRAFMNCTNLRSAPLSSSYTGLQSIGERAFANCDTLSGVSIPANVETLGEACFADCANLKTASIYGGLAEIPQDCFKNCPKLLRTGGTAAAYAGLKRVDESAFEGCTSLEITSSWSLEKYANLEYVGDNAFKGAITHTQEGSGNARLDAITLAPTLTHIGAHAFDGCIGLAKVTLQSNPEIGEGAFANMRDGFVLEKPGEEQPASANAADAADGSANAEAADAADAGGGAGAAEDAAAADEGVAVAGKKETDPFAATDPKGEPA